MALTQARISLRLPTALKNELTKRAYDRNMSLSDYIRSVIISHMEPIDDRWKIIIWNLLGVDIVRVDNALRKSYSIESFIARILPYVTKEVKISPNLAENNYTSIDFKLGEKVYNITYKRKKSIEQSVADIMYMLDNKIMEEYDEKEI